MAKKPNDKPTMTPITADAPEAKSLDVVAANLNKLKALFPEAVSEDGVNVDVLNQLIGRTVTDAEEKYGLNWHGKRKARQLALTPSSGTLRPCPEESVDWGTTQNLFIEGDNLEVLKLLQKSYANKVKMIYIDPPYNTGRDFIYPDDFSDNITNYQRIMGWRTEDGEKVSSLASHANPENSGRYHTNWLNMMYPRLKVSRNVLREDGAIFISVDDTELANLRKACDEIFGEENFLANLVWEKVHTRKNSARYFSVSHDHIVVYAKQKEAWNRHLIPRDNTDAYTNPDNDPKGPWKPDPVYANNPYDVDYTITKPNGVVLKRPRGRYWRFSEDTIKAKIAGGEVVWGEGDSYPMIKRYLSEVQDGLVPVTLLTRTFAGDNAVANNELKALLGVEKVMDYPKPSLLIKRLAQTTMGPGDVLLDFFAGSGTSAHAIMDMNIDDGGARRFIMVQLPEQCEESSEAFKMGLRTIADIAKERIRRVGTKLCDDGSEVGVDTGFRVFKLDTSNIRAWSPDPDDLAGTLHEHTEHLAVDRSEADVLYELLLKLGLDLAVPIETRQVEGKDVHAVGAGTLFACLAESISRDDVEALAQAIIDWHKELAPEGETTIVFRDSGFADDVAKSNLAAILVQAGFDDTRIRSL